MKNQHQKAALTMPRYRRAGIGAGTHRIRLLFVFLLFASVLTPAIADQNCVADPGRLSGIREVKGQNGKPKNVSFLDGATLEPGSRLRVVVTSNCEARVSARFIDAKATGTDISKSVSMQAGSISAFPGRTDWVTVGDDEGSVTFSVVFEIGGESIERRLVANIHPVGRVSGTFPDAGEGGFTEKITDPLVASIAWRPGDDVLGKGTKAVSYVLAWRKPIRVRGAVWAKYRDVEGSVVFVTTGHEMGSGVVIAEHGVVLTNYHVVGNEETVLAAFPAPGDPIPGNFIAGEVIKIDEVADLALIRLKEVPDGVRPVELGDLAKLSVTEQVHAIGHPQGQTWTYTAGIVSQIRKGYEWGEGDTRPHRATVIQTQTPINPGNSGGPLFNDEGQLVGVNSFVRLGADGLNYAVAIDTIREFLESRDDYRRVPASSPEKLAAQPDEVRGRPFDSDGDGKADSSLIDLDGDDKGDAIGFDTNGDGQIDELQLDRNGDGKVDTRVVEGPKNIAKLLIYVDEDGDGSPDVIGFDVDGDMRPEQVSRA